MSQLGDKERLLAGLLKRLAPVIYDPKKAQNYQYTFIDGASQPKSGDMVLCLTAREPHPWTLSWWCEAIPGGGLVREIGGERLCRIVNENFGIVRNAPFDWLLEGRERRFAEKLRRWHSLNYEYGYRIGRLVFEGNRVRVEIRAPFDGFTPGRGYAQPFYASFKWSLRTTYAQIGEAMRAAGYGTHKFVYELPKKQPPYRLEGTKICKTS
jgi:hypothetical protein